MVVPLNNQGTVLSFSVADAHTTLVCRYCLWNKIVNEKKDDLAILGRGLAITSFYQGHGPGRCRNKKGYEEWVMAASDDDSVSSDETELDKKRAGEADFDGVREKKKLAPTLSYNETGFLENTAEKESAKTTITTERMLVPDTATTTATTLDCADVNGPEPDPKGKKFIHQIKTLCNNKKGYRGCCENIASMKVFLAKHGDTSSSESTSTRRQFYLDAILQLH